MQCPACRRDVPMSFKCRACGAPMVRTAAPAPAATPRPRPIVPTTTTEVARTPDVPPPRATPPAAAQRVLQQTGSAPAAPPQPPITASAARQPAPAESVNPYAAPVRPPAARAPVPPPRTASLFAEPLPQQPLADRGARLVAQLLDGLLALGCGLPGIVLIALSPERPGADAGLVLPALGMILLLGGLLGLLVYQLRLLAGEGQTWGKLKMKIRIVRYDTGEIPGLGRTVGLRLFVNNLIGSIPCVGPLYSLADILFIFGEERRCLHDLLAGTKVVEAA